MDIAVASYLNGFVRKSMTVDLCFSLVGTNDLFKAAILITILWWFWFRQDNTGRAYRDHITITMFSCLLALSTARLLAVTLPFRVRPIHESSLGLAKPFGISPMTLDSWNSFPSDHAVLFFALAAGMLLLSRKLGLFALLYTAVVICFPRLYLGLHYLTDILAGALIGVSITALASSSPARRLILPTVHAWIEKSPPTFYACFFFLSFQLAVLFEPVRSLGSKAFRIYQHIF